MGHFCLSPTPEPKASSWAQTHDPYALGLPSLLFLLLDEKQPKNQGRLHRTSPRLSKRLTFKSGSACRQTQAPLRESQEFSHPLRALPRPAAPPPRPTQSRVGIPGLRDGLETLPPLYRTPSLCRHRGSGPAISYALGLPSLLFLLLDEKQPKNQGRLHRTSPRLSKRLTFKSGSACRQTQAPLRESQAFSHPLRALPRPAAPPPRPTQSRVGIPGLRDGLETLPPLYRTPSLCRHRGAQTRDLLRFDFALSKAYRTNPTRLMRIRYRRKLWA
jgi:hypothetical protein